MIRARWRLYEQGKKHFYQKRGQLNMACADCHKFYAGNLIRADLLSPALGHLTHFPVYRSKWGGLGTTHRRYEGCNKQVRAKPYKPQSAEYRALEYFHTYMSNGLIVNGPGGEKVAGRKTFQPPKCRASVPAFFISNGVAYYQTGQFPRAVITLHLAFVTRVAND